MATEIRESLFEDTCRQIIEVENIIELIIFLRIQKN